MAYYYAPALSYSGIGEILRQQNILKGLGQYGLTPSQIEKYAQAAIAQMYEPYVNRATRMYELSLQDQRARQELDFRKEQAQQAVRASTLGALTNLAGTAGLGYLGYKLLLKPSDVTNVVPTVANTGLTSSSFVFSPLTPRDLSGMGAYTGSSAGTAGTAGTTAGAAGTAGETATSGLSSLTSSPYFIPGVGGALRTGIGLVTGEEPKKAISSGVGTAVGAYIGQAIAPVPGIGAVIGGAIGSVVGNLFRGCIIISAIHGRDSEEVDIARRFRDSFLDLPTLRGYYFLADRVVPLMELDPNFKQHVKQTLVDRLIRFGRAFFAKKQADNIDTNTTINFLTLCRCLGLQMTSYHRLNGEVI